MTTEVRDDILQFIVANASKDDDAFSEYERLRGANRNIAVTEVEGALRELACLGFVENIDTLSGIYTTVVMQAGRDYLDNKRASLHANARREAADLQEKRRIERNEWIKFWIPISLSIIAIVISIIALSK